MHLESSVLSTPEFKKFSEKHVMFLNIMTRIRGYPDDDLLRAVGGRGFPTLVVLDSSGEVVAKPATRSVAETCSSPRTMDAILAEASSSWTSFVRR